MSDSIREKVDFELMSSMLDSGLVSVQSFKEYVAAEICYLNQRLESKEVELKISMDARDTDLQDYKNAQVAAEQVSKELSVKVAELDQQKRECMRLSENMNNLEAELASHRQKLNQNESILRRSQHACCDHSRARYELAQKINVLQDELVLKTKSLLLASHRIKLFEKDSEDLKLGIKNALKEKSLAQLQHHQVAQELEEVMTSNQSNQLFLQDLNQQLFSKNAEYEIEQEKRVKAIERVKILEEELEAAMQSLDSAVASENAARKEAQLALLQRQQIQDELNRCELLIGEQQILLASHEKQQRRATKLLGIAYAEKDK